MELRNMARYKHCERGWTVPSMIFSKWLTIWANGNARWDAGSWPERQAADRQIDRPNSWMAGKWRGDFSFTIPGTVVYCNTGWVVHPAGVSAVQLPYMALPDGMLGLQRHILIFFLRVNTGLGKCQRAHQGKMVVVWRRNYFKCFIYSNRISYYYYYTTTATGCLPNCR